MAHARVVQDFRAFLHRSLNYLNKKRLHGIIMTHDSWGPAIFCCSCPFLSGTKKGGSALILTYLIPVYIGFINQLTLLPVGVGWGHFCCRLSGNFEIWPDIKGQNIRPDCQCIPSICTPLSARHDTHRIYYLCGSCLVFTLLSEIFPHPSNIHYTALRNLVETLQTLPLQYSHVPERPIVADSGEEVPYPGDPSLQRQDLGRRQPGGQAG